MTELRIACIGDVMCGDLLYRLGWGAASQIKRYGRKFVPEAVARVLRSHDVALCNVESVLSDVGRDEASVRSLHMRGRPESAGLLAEWGITAANLANNHILDHGLAAAEDTAAVLKTNGIAVAGIGEDGTFTTRPSWTVIEAKGVQVGILGFCLLGQKYAYRYRGDMEVICSEIEQRRRAGEVVVVSVHWGDELIDRPSVEQRACAARLLGAGATVVAGHHPHVVQGLWQKEGGLVAYSLGDFIFDSWSELTGWSMILSVTVRENQVAGLEVIPIVRGRDYRPELAEGALKARIKREIERRNRLAEEAVGDEEAYRAMYEAELKRLNRREKLEQWRRVATTFWRNRPRYWPGILVQPIQRIIGQW